jgi:hypothetical protein
MIANVKASSANFSLQNLPKMLGIMKHYRAKYVGNDNDWYFLVLIL